MGRPRKGCKDHIYLECWGTEFMMAMLMNYFPSYIRRTHQFFSDYAGCFECESDYTQLKTLMRNPINSGTIFYETTRTWRQFTGTINCVIVASNVCGSTVFYFFHFPIRTPSNLKWLLDFYKIFAPMNLSLFWQSLV